MDADTCQRCGYDGSQDGTVAYEFERGLYLCETCADIDGTPADYQREIIDPLGR